jgi:hypothetical protein
LILEQTLKLTENCFHWDGGGDHDDNYVVIDVITIIISELQAKQRQ